MTNNVRKKATTKSTSSAKGSSLKEDGRWGVSSGLESSTQASATVSDMSDSSGDDVYEDDGREYSKEFEKTLRKKHSLACKAMKVS